ncbi:MAG: PrsW family intramembrane metalloprotease [Candidatus Yonathbacteria bacterium]|nr:PrsW family intramembrane metalloprotease [Candidatus Yonathbacteria bacterium]
MAETILTWEPYAIAIAGGIIPALVWLLFWLREDRRSPEPTGLIALSFFAGMAVVYFVLPLQKLVVTGITPAMNLVNMLAVKLVFVPPAEQTVQITLWAFIEEFAKYSTVFFIAFKSKFFDEPIDAVIYLLTAALGFAAMENILYIMKDITHISTAQIFLDGNLRFIGATILHTVSSAFVGLAIAFSFYGSRFVKVIAIIAGLIGATLLHAYFNLSIMEVNGTMNTLWVFSRFWIAILGIIVLLQIVKRLTPNN